VSDPAGHDPVSFWLAYLHPAWMVLGLVMAALTLRAGLRLRSARRRGVRRAAADRRAHLRLAKPTLAVLVAGYAGGLVSAVWLRGFEPLGSAHALAGSVALALFLATGALGLLLERARSRAVEVHARLGLVAMLAAAAAVGTGFVLLP
jgi:hypothetical protein